MIWLGIAIVVWVLALVLLARHERRRQIRELERLEPWAFPPKPTEGRVG